MRTGMARLVVLLTAIAVATVYAVPAGCGDLVHVASCCKSHCPDHDAPPKRAPCCGVSRDPGYPATANAGLQAPSVAFALAPPGSALAATLRPLMATLAREPGRIRVPIFLALLTLRR